MRPETSPDDIHGMIAAEGILTSRGGLVSHAAVVARGMGTPAVCGASELDIDVEGRRVPGERRHRARGRRDLDQRHHRRGGHRRGAGGHARARAGPFDVDPRAGPTSSGACSVRTNADLPARRRGGAPVRRRGHRPVPHRAHVPRRPAAARAAVHPRRRPRPRRTAALDELEKLQRSDFEGIFEAMDGLPVTIRLLDPPLHEFLPDVEELLVREARGELDDEGRQLLAAAQLWREANPMLGTRGCRLGIIKPGLYQMQAKAILEAAHRAQAGRRRPARRDHDPADRHRGRARAAHATGCARSPPTCSRPRAPTVDYLVGTMVETPRAALVAGEIAEVAEFFSFGTNDLTQMTFGFSRDDVEGRFMSEYLELKLLRANPFETLDQEGVGQLVRLGVERGRAARPGHQARHLRRARRRPGVGRVLRRGRARLRVVLALPGADRPAGRGPRVARRRRPRDHRVAERPVVTRRCHTRVLSIAP